MPRDCNDKNCLPRARVKGHLVLGLEIVVDNSILNDCDTFKPCLSATIRSSVWQSGALALKDKPTLGHISTLSTCGGLLSLNGPINLHPFVLARPALFPSLSTRRQNVGKRRIAALFYLSGQIFLLANAATVFRNLIQGSGSAYIEPEAFHCST